MTFIFPAFLTVPYYVRHKKLQFTSILKVRTWSVLDNSGSLKRTSPWETITHTKTPPYGALKVMNITDTIGFQLTPLYESIYPLYPHSFLYSIHWNVTTISVAGSSESRKAKSRTKGDRIVANGQQCPVTPSYILTYEVILRVPS